MALTAKKIFLQWVIPLVLLPALIISGEGKNILLITLDTTRADHIGCYNERLNVTPNINKLGNQGVIYENCYSNTPLTLPAHASMLTGKHPFVMDVRNNGWYTLDSNRKTITGLLKKRGYFTFAVISSYVLASKFGLSRDFDIYDDSLNVGEPMVTQSSQIPAHKVFNKFRIHLSKTGGKKFFGWVHFYDPHIPYSPPGEYKKRFEKDPYLGEIAYMDLYVGKVMDELKKKGLLDSTTIIIAGDHGEDKGEHGEFSHGIFCYDVSLKVPLIIWNGAGLKSGRRVKTLVKLTDIYQAISELSGPGGVGGDSFLLTSARGEETVHRNLYFESLYAKEQMGWAPLTGMISGDYKYISLPEPELYNLKKDPGETSNIFNTEKETARRIDKKLSLFYRRNSGVASRGKRKLSREDEANLASLGYISSFKKSDKQIDPKTGVRYLNKLRAIRTAVSEGKLSSAERDLKKLFFSRERIDTIHAYEIFDALYRRKKDEKNLLKFREMAVRDFPQSMEFANLLANSYFLKGRMDDAEKVSRNILKKFEDNTQAIILLGKIHIVKKEYAAALSEFRKAEAIEPMNFEIKRKIARALRSAGRRAEAVRLLEKISGNTRFRSNPDNIGLLTGVALQMFNTGAGEKGLSLLDQLISIHRNRPEPLITTGTILSKMKRDEEALKFFSKSIGISGKNSLAFSKRGVSQLMLFMKKRDPLLLDSAIRDFSTAISLNPGLAEAYSGRGTAYIFKKRSPKAVKDLERALELDPRLVDVYFNLGIIYLQSGRKDKARRLFLQCREIFSRTLRPAQLKRLDNLLRESQ